MSNYSRRRGVRFSQVLGIFILSFGLRAQDQAVTGAFQHAEPQRPFVTIIQRFPVGEQLDLVIALAKSQRTEPPPLGGFWWTTADRLGLFLQDRSNVYHVVIAPGPNDDCLARVERITAQDLVLSCRGEKWSVYDNQKFVYDVRAKALVKAFSYPPFKTVRIQSGPRFVVSDGQRTFLVDSNLKIVSGEPDKPGSDPVVPAVPEMKEEIGPRQVDTGRIWFGKTFYDAEGETGTGGFGYFDIATGTHHLYAPPEIQRWSVSAILVEPDFLWLALDHRGEYGNYEGGLLRWDRRTEQATHYNVHGIVGSIASQGDRLFLGAEDGMIVLRGEQIQSYFVDRAADGSYRIAPR
jgi:hypothetical protein